MTMIQTNRADPTPLAALANQASFARSSPPWSDNPSVAGTSLIDRFLAPPTSSSPANLTPVQLGEAARASDIAGATAAAAGAAAAAAAGAVGGAALGGALGAAAGAAVGAALTHHPITVGSAVTHRPNGTTLTTVHIDVAANFRIDGGSLPAGRTAATEARSIERSIERDFSKTYRDANGNETRYVTDVRMATGRPAEPGREQFVLVSGSDPRLGGAGTLGMAPGFENGRTAYVSDQAGARTAPHEFGHLAGLRHTAQVDQGCTTAPGINVENLMSQTGCSPTSQQLERSQLQQIFNTSQFH